MFNKLTYLLTYTAVPYKAHHVRRSLAEARSDRRWEDAAVMDDADAEGLLHNYDMYKAEGDLHLKKGLLVKAADNYTKVCRVSKPYYRQCRC